MKEKDLNKKIQEAQARAAFSANAEMVLLYWQIGREILEKQAMGWENVIERLSKDLVKEFPDNKKGFSERNLKYMKAFAEAYPDELFVQQVVALLPWGHNIVLLDKLSTAEEREWYAKASIEHGWSEVMLVHHIETELMKRADRTPCRLADPEAEPTDEQFTWLFEGLSKEAQARSEEARKRFFDEVKDETEREKLKAQFRKVFGNKPETPPMTEDEIDAEVKAYRRERIAVELYEKRLVSQETASEMAGLSRVEFIEALAKYGVSPFQTTAEELEAEVDRESKNLGLDKDKGKPRKKPKP